MNIYIINVDSQPQYIGGIKRVCVSLAHQWILQGINVCFICIGFPNLYRMKKLLSTISVKWVGEKCHAQTSFTSQVLRTSKHN